MARTARRLSNTNAPVARPGASAAAPGGLTDEARRKGQEARKLENKAPQEAALLKQLDIARAERDQHGKDSSEYTKADQLVTKLSTDLKDLRSDRLGGVALDNFIKAARKLGDMGASPNYHWSPDFVAGIRSEAIAAVNHALLQFQPKERTNTKGTPVLSLSQRFKNNQRQS